MKFLYFCGLPEWDTLEEYSYFIDNTCKGYSQHLSLDKAELIAVLEELYDLQELA